MYYRYMFTEFAVMRALCTQMYICIYVVKVDDREKERERERESVINYKNNARVHACYLSGACHTCSFKRSISYWLTMLY